MSDESLMKVSRVRLASYDADFEEARALGRALVDWQLKVYPELREPILAYYDPVDFEQTLAALPIVHARPKGAVLLADLGGPAVGCVMYLEMEPGIAEVKRLFVDETGRGHGLGRTLLETMFVQMQRDGYQKARFISGRYLNHARKLYESLGFAEIPLPLDYPDEFRELDYFMERTL
jgi:GNAT superfamily N-acetyltransferase